MAEKAAGADAAMLEEVQRLPACGARAVEPFAIDGTTFLAVPQLAQDVEGAAPTMTGGDSDVDTLVFRRRGGRFELHQRLPVPGGEDAAAFAIGARRFLAVASLRRGKGPYEMALPSTIFEWRAGTFSPFQSVAGHAAKQWTPFVCDGRVFLALAQGAAHGPGDVVAHSTLLAWDGERFMPFQDVPSAWGYNWLYAELDGERLLLHADHAVPSCVLRWNGTRFEPWQELEGGSGRAFCLFRASGRTWLAFARLQGETELLRWEGGAEGGRFVRHAVISGPGGRELEWLPDGAGGGWLVQVDFIVGSREAPVPVQRSTVHAWRGDGFESVETFATTGATDVAAFEADGERFLAVSNALAPGVRFAADVRIFRVRLPASSLADRVGRRP
jgi:hypothetical protein